MSHRFETVFSADFLLRDADESEPATAGRKRWTEGFHGRDVGHNSHGWPMFAVTGQTAQQLAEWSVRYREESFRQCRTWTRDDTEARAIADSGSALYKWNDCYLTSSWRNQRTGDISYGRAIQLHHGLHLVDGHSWMQVDADLVDIIHGTPADVEPLRLTVTGDDLRNLTHAGGDHKLAVTTLDGTPIILRLAVAHQ